MGRRAKPRIKQGWYVTDAGGSTLRLARVAEGYDVALERLAVHLGRVVAPAAPAYGMSVRESYEKFMSHAKVYYRLPNGKPSQEYTEGFPLAFREVLAICGDLPIAALDRKMLRQARQKMIEAGLSRRVVNQRVGRVKRALAWLVEEELIPERVAESVALLRPLPAGRSAAPETEPIKPVKAAVVKKTLPHLAEPWRSMVLLQWHSGMRPGEVCGLKASYLAPAGRQTLVADFGKDHKMAYRGRARRVVIGPSGVAVIARHLYLAIAAGREYVFVSSRTEEPVLRTSYDTTIAKACVKAGAPHWHPNQIRHTHLTRVRRKFGLDAAQVAGGHAKADVTQVYAEADLDLAAKVAAAMG